MMPRRTPLALTLAFALLLAAAAHAAEPPAQPAARPVPVIFDTDMDSDCDDPGALAILHALADRGEVRILGTMVSAHHPWSAPCVDAINTWCGRPDLPIGVPKCPPAYKQGSAYAQKVAEEFPHDCPGGDAAPDALPIYRRLLAAEPDASVVIVTVGDLTNMRLLVESAPDAISPLSGRDLVAKKVKHWVCMGTRYPSDLDPGRWGNFKPDPESTVRSIAAWPTPIIFTGGQEFAERLATGAGLAALPQKNPVRRSYELYFKGQVKSRHSADPIAVMVAARGAGTPWLLVTKGYNHIFPNGTHEWRDEPDNPNHAYVSALAEGVEYRDVAAQMEALMIEGAKGKKSDEAAR
jgi:hypothetical protein